MPTLLPIHIAAGGLAIVLGSIALAVRKGGPLHRRIGLAFAYAKWLTIGAMTLAIVLAWLWRIRGKRPIPIRQ